MTLCSGTRTLDLWVRGGESGGGVGKRRRESARGLSADDAKLKFCQAYGRAMSDERAALNFRKY